MKTLLKSILPLWLLLTGCSLDIPYENQFSDPDAISTTSTARELLATAYSQLPNLEYDLSILSDDFEPTYWARTNPTLLNQYNWTAQSFQDLSQATWSDYYTVIATVNALQERLPKINPASDADRATLTELMADSNTLKAYCYWQLLRLYGPDPADGLQKDAIVLKDKVEMQNLKRSSVEQTIAEIRRLLSLAMAESRPDSESHWLQLTAARTLAAELELYAGNYSDAITLAQQVIDAKGLATLEAVTYRNLWGNSQCEERIFVYDYPTTASSFYLGLVYDRNNGDYFTVNSELQYSADDIRGPWSIYQVHQSVLGGVQNYLGKYNRLRKEQTELTQINKLRLSGAIFTKALAQAHSGQEAEALKTLNEYLTRRGAETLDESLSGNALLRAILLEKQKEFVGEGERYFDLRHYRHSVLADWSGSRKIKADDYRWCWPIPRDEYLYNDQMTQNDGWPMTNFN